DHVDKVRAELHVELDAGHARERPGPGAGERFARVAAEREVARSRARDVDVLVVVGQDRQIIGCKVRRQTSWSASRPGRPGPPARRCRERNASTTENAHWPPKEHNFVSTTATDDSRNGS